jgi:hypothetical protein
LVSPRVRALARSPSDSRRQPLWLTSEKQPVAVTPYMGVRGRCVHGADPGLTSVANGLHAPGRQAYGRGYNLG